MPPRSRTDAPPTTPSKEVVVRFERGTLVVEGLAEDFRLESAVELRYDPRSACHRTYAFAYAPLMRELGELGFSLVDRARAYQNLEFSGERLRAPRGYQSEALTAWLAQKGRGVVVLPTGAGKTQVGLMAIASRARSTLVVAPTLELVRQWYELLVAAFGQPVGVVGGGQFDVQPLTVITYDSAHLHQENLGARFGLLIFDEVHHLPSHSYRLAASLSLAPYRLGLTATFERADALEAELSSLVGPVVYERDITELEGEYLAEYDTQRVVVELSERERAEYDEARGLYLGFVRRHQIRMGSPRGWSEFIRLSARSREGRLAFEAYRRQRTLAVCAEAKLVVLGELLFRHRRDRAIIFTLDNATAYEISSRFLVPTITHQTRVRERAAVLSAFADGRLGVVVTSRVLNEGVDVPEANVAVVVSGTGSVREHVQRLGRILRPKNGKRAILYEIVAKGTGEQSTSERRREHVAYRSREC